MNIFEDILEYIKTHIEKTIFLSVLFLFLFYLVCFSFKFFFDNSGKEKTADMVKQLELAGKRSLFFKKPLIKTDYVQMSREIKRFSYYEQIIARDIFLPFKNVDIKKKKFINPYILKEIIKRECPLEWKGVMANKTGTKMFAQINAGGKTFFVKASDDVLGYNILDVNRVYVEIKNKATLKCFRLDLNKKILEDKISAKIYNTKKREYFIVSEGDNMEGWDIKTVDDDVVKILKNDEVVYIKKALSEENV